jgi:hypothetical protein
MTIKLSRKEDKMRLKKVYQEFDELNKPYQGNATVTPETLHKEVMKHIDSIGNSNPHWNRLNEIENELRSFYLF